MTTSNNSKEEILEGIFFVHDQTIIEEEWCPLCKEWTKFEAPVKIVMEHVDKRILNCGHELTYLFLVEHINGVRIETIRRRYY